MKWFRFMFGDDRAGRRRNPLFVSEEELYGVDTDDLKTGTVIESWDSRAVVASESAAHDGDPDDVLLEVSMLPIVSERLRTALAAEQVGENDIQWLPVNVHKSDGTAVPGFAFVNVLSVVAGFDRSESKFSIREGQTDPFDGEPHVARVRKFALKSSALVGYDVVRLREFCWPIFVSERFRDVYRRLGCTGAVFSEVLVTPS